MNSLNAVFKCLVVGLFISMYACTESHNSSEHIQLNNDLKTLDDDKIKSILESVKYKFSGFCDALHLHNLPRIPIPNQPRGALFAAKYKLMDGRLLIVLYDQKSDVINSCSLHESMINENTKE